MEDDSIFPINFFIIEIIDLNTLSNKLQQQQKNKIIKVKNSHGRLPI